MPKRDVTDNKTYGSNDKKLVKELQEEILFLKESIEKKDKLIQEYSEVINSRRLRFANFLAGSFNKVFPKKSLRRSVATKSLKFVYQIPKKARDFVVKVANYKAFHLVKKTLDFFSKNKKAIFVYDSIEWNSPLKQRPQHLAEQLSRLGYGVVYLDYRMELKEYLKVNDNLIVIPKCKLYLDLISKISRQVDVYYMLPSTQAVPLDELMSLAKNGCKVIYEYIDDFNEQISGAMHHQIKIFNSLNEVNPILLLGSANNLLDDLKKEYPDKNILVSKNAVNLEHFDYRINKPASMPKDLKKAVRPKTKIVGYYGAIAPWLDYKLIQEMADKLPNVDFVFLGIDYGDSLKNLPKRKNIHFLGQKSYDELPNYALFFDAAIIPFSLGDIAKSTSPVKLFEYMAMGLPTVGTRDLYECKGYEGVLISKNNADFIKNIQKAIDMKRDALMRKKIIGYAMKNTWEARAIDIDRAIEKIKEGSLK